MYSYHTVCTAYHVIFAVRSLSSVCKVEVLVGFDVAAQNIFAAQRSLESKTGAILQRIMQMQAISCTSGQAPSVKVGMLAMDSASEPVLLDFTDDYAQLFDSFKALRTRGPYILNAKTIKAYNDQFRNRASDVVKVRLNLLPFLLLLTFGVAVYFVFILAI